MSRRAFVGGNWKCNGTAASNAELVSALNSAEVPSSVEVIVAPATLHLDAVKRSIRPEISVCAQNCWHKGNGAYTGEISAEMLVDYGLKWVLLGHSERRHILKETDEMIAEKCKKSLSVGLSVVACIGELLAERQAGKTEEVVAAQMRAYVDAITDASVWESRVVIAYEPVWAIGTGVTASPEQAQEVHAYLRRWLAENVSAAVAQSARIIYGGSVSAKNADELYTQPDVDGFLVGGASLKAADFASIIKSASRSK